MGVDCAVCAKLFRSSLEEGHPVLSRVTFQNEKLLIHKTEGEMFIMQNKTLDRQTETLITDT